MQILRFTADSVPRRRCHAISAKADELRSTVSQGLQGFSPEELQARQQQLQQHLAQQQAQRLQEQQELQVSVCACALSGAAPVIGHSMHVAHSKGGCPAESLM